MRNKLIENILLSNASQLGFNWIYNSEFLKEYAKKNEMLMKVPNEEMYRKVKPSYHAYPNAPLGTLSVQGEILKWLYDNWEKDSTYSPHEYYNLLLNAFKPGGFYYGYVESYGRILVYNYLANEMKNKDLIPLNDDQLVGFMPYLAAKALNKSNNEAFEFTKVLTKDETYLELFNLLDLVIDNKKSDDLILNNLNKLNNDLIDKIRNGILIKDTDEFLKHNDGTSCSVIKSMPIIFHLYLKHDNLLDALKENVVIGGASSDRALLLGFLYKNDNLPSDWFYL